MPDNLFEYYEQSEVCGQLQRAYYDSKFEDVVNIGDDYLDDPVYKPVHGQVEALVWLFMAWFKLKRGERVKEVLTEITDGFSSPDFGIFHPFKPFPYRIEQFTPFSNILSLFEHVPPKLLDNLLDLHPLPLARSQAPVTPPVAKVAESKLLPLQLGSLQGSKRRSVSPGSPGRGPGKVRRTRSSQMMQSQIEGC